MQYGGGAAQENGGAYGDLSNSGNAEAADLFNVFMTPAGRGEINLGSQHLPGLNYNDEASGARLQELLGRTPLRKS